MLLLPAHHELMDTKQDEITATHDILRTLEGNQLSSVEFVMDYLQLHFDGRTLTLTDWPVLVKDGQEIGIGDTGYRNHLCGEIAILVKKVSLVTEEAQRETGSGTFINAVLLEMESGTVLKIDTSWETRVDVEALRFDADNVCLIL